MLITDDVSLHQCESLPVPLTGLAAVAVPPVVPSLRSESLAILLHTNLTYRDWIQELMDNILKMTKFID